MAPGRANITCSIIRCTKLDNRRRVELHKKYIGFVFQQYHLLDNLTVAENLDLPLSYRDIKKAEREGMVADILDRFQIVGKKALYPNQLSGGQQQLVAVARAVIGKPKLILADEPTGSLHSSQGKMIMDLLKKLNDDGTTIIQVTHNDAWAAYGNRIIQLADGWIVDGEKTVAQLAVRSEPDAIAVQAERLAHRRDEAHAPAALGILVFGRGRARIGVRHFDQRPDLARNRGDNLVRRQNLTAAP